MNPQVLFQRSIAKIRRYSRLVLKYEITCKYDDNPARKG